MSKVRIDELAESIEAMCDMTQPISPAMTRPVKPGGQELLDQRREGQVAFLQHALVAQQAALGIVEAEGDDARQHDQHGHQQLQKAGEHDAHLAVPDRSWPPGCAG